MSNIINRKDFDIIKSFNSYEEYIINCSSVDYIDPITNLKELMRRAGYKQKDLICIFKTASIASEVLSCKRALTVEHIRGLSKLFNVSADLFI